MTRHGKAYLHCHSRPEAQKIWWERLAAAGFFTSLSEEEIEATAAMGRVTARSLYACQSVPHYNGSAMDGIAVRSTDTFGASETSPVVLKVLPLDEPYEPGCCYVVDTGELMPAGTDSVIMIEDVHMVEGRAEIMAAVSPWQHVRVIGEDIVAHELVLPEYHQISPYDVGAMLAAGLERIPVVAKPKVAVIPTGNEIVATRAELKPGAILDINSHMIAAAVTVWGGIARRYPIVRDDAALLKQAVLDALEENDIIITNAGTSAGTEDFTEKVLAEIGEVIIHGVAIKPGKPVVLAICQGKPVIGLPGYPVSAMLTAELFVREVVQRRQKLPATKDSEIEAVTAKQMYSHLGVDEYIRVSVGTVQGKTVAAPLGRGAGLLSSLTKAQGVLIIDKTSDGLPAGTTATVKLFDNAATTNLLAVGSHDLALDLLGVFLKRKTNRELTCANVGSMGGIMAIRNEECHIAGIHLLDVKTGEYNIPYLEKYLKGRPWRLVHLARREQGLIVSPGNPKGIYSLTDLTKAGVTYVNRQRGAGTRMLLDFQLAQQGMEGQLIRGYDKEVGTHMAVAATVAAGAADAGLGIRAAAKALGLDFIPVGFEQYDLILNFEPGTVEEKEIIEILLSTAFRNEVDALGGYDLTHSGITLAISDGKRCTINGFGN